jgi:hypothetical protein
MPSKNDLRQVTSNEHGVCIQFVDARNGVIHQFTMTWKKLEAFAKKHGEKLTTGDVTRTISKHVRDAMESED